jgi:DNA-binding LytR/AlgR family response regulator
MRIAICDDDPLCLEQTARMIERWATQNAIHLALFRYESGDDLLCVHEKLPFDALFLDICMPYFSGMDLAHELRASDKTTDIVFLTSSPDFAVESYRVSAFDYLLKPVTEADVFSTLDRLYAARTQLRRSLIIKTAGAFQRIYLEDVDFIEAINRGTVFNLVQGESVYSMQPFHEIETELSNEPSFFKCHRSYIINVSHINTYTKTEIRTVSGAIVPISRSLSAAFEDVYFSQLFGKVGDLP